MDFLYGTQSILFFISTVWLSDTPADSGRSIPPGGVSQHHAHAFSGLITAQQVQNLPECGSAAWLQHLRWSDKGETSSYTYTVSWVSASMVAVSSCTQSVWAALFISLHTRIKCLLFLLHSVSWRWLCRHEEGWPPEYICRGPAQDARCGEVGCDLYNCLYVAFN